MLERLSGTRVSVDAILDGDRCLVRSNGLREAGLPEVEIADCPLKLKDIASDLVVQIALNGKETPESLAEGKTIGGRFVRRDQPLIEAFRLVLSDRNSSVLRIVDMDSTGAFPHRLVATHLCAAAGASSRDGLRLLLVSIEVWPKEKMASNAALGDYEYNPNNFWSWVDLGTKLAQTGRTADALLQWKTAVCMWPRGGKLYASRMIGRNSQGPLHEFWLSVTNDVIRRWCVQSEVALPESALTD